MKGHLIVNAFHRLTGRHLWTRETDNTVVYLATVHIARLMGDTGTGFPITLIGFGSGTSATTLGMQQLVTARYLRSLGTATISGGPPSSPGKVTFAWSLNEDATLDYGATGFNIQEIGLHINPDPLDVPRVVTNSNIAAWQGTHAYTAAPATTASVVRATATDDVHYCSTAGTSGGSEPTWATTIGATTSDGSVTWTMQAKADFGVWALAARALMPLGVITPAVGFSSTWSITV